MAVAPDVRIVLPGKPRAWQRSGERVIVPRSGARPFVHHFTKAQTAKEQDGLRFIAQATMRGRTPFDGPIDLRMTAWMPVPPSWSKQKQADALAGLIFPTGTPDLDNITKNVKDALKAIVFRDDALVVLMVCHKLFCAIPRIVIEVRLITTPARIASSSQGAP